MKCNTISYDLDINILILYELLQSMLENRYYSKQVKDKIVDFSNYLYSMLYDKNNCDIVSLDYVCNITYKL